MFESYRNQVESGSHESTNFIKTDWVIIYRNASPDSILDKSKGAFIINQLDGVMSPQRELIVFAD